MNGLNISFTADAGGRSEKVVLSAASAQSAVLLGSAVVVTPDVNCFIRMDVNPVALPDVDRLLVANVAHRVTVSPGMKLALIAAGAGNAYITQEP